jgi:hypothetical protein
MKHKPSDAIQQKLGIIEKLFCKRLATGFCCTYHKTCSYSIVNIEKTLIFQVSNASFNRLKPVCLDKMCLKKSIFAKNSLQEV